MVEFGEVAVEVRVEIFVAWSVIGRQSSPIQSSPATAKCKTRSVLATELQGRGFVEVTSLQDCCY